jgi:glycosyltransferase involved in cell wall biosynthesis
LLADTIAPTFSVSVRERVRVLPRISIDEQIAELNGHAIFLFPSLSEGFGFALLEAMAMGLAPVTTMTGMGADWLVDREHAMIVPAGSALHIAEAVSSLIRNPELRVSVARNAARLASRFTIDAFVEGYEAAFERRAVPSRT